MKHRFVLEHRGIAGRESLRRRIRLGLELAAHASEGHGIPVVHIHVSRDDVATIHFERDLPPLPDVHAAWVRRHAPLTHRRRR